VSLYFSLVDKNLQFYIHTLPASQPGAPQSHLCLHFRTVENVICLQNSVMFRSLGWDLCEPDVCHDLRLGLHHALQHPRKFFTQLGTGIEADADGIGIPASQVRYRSIPVLVLLIWYRTSSAIGIFIHSGYLTRYRTDWLQDSLAFKRLYEGGK
jgi:hypothetical protein